MMAKIYKPKSLEELKELVNDKNIHLGDIDTAVLESIRQDHKWNEKRDPVQRICGDAGFGRGGQCGDICQKDQIYLKGV